MIVVGSVIVSFMRKHNAKLPVASAQSSALSTQTPGTKVLTLALAGLRFRLKLKIMTKRLKRCLLIRMGM